eukprot:CAMPEP_0170743586 /NCGR_PEP_ID=MMETSP0437-20130122/7344_1 /TAXON_ID=0 /ORGANISM="Sexangularia sp." /LENGTH=550 /DNA_ID=CAMNT_0011082259 /DNA_START=114 /DNA_END=1766 /DNA_ORIENTATION=+
MRRDCPTNAGVSAAPPRGRQPDTKKRPGAPGPERQPVIAKRPAAQHVEASRSVKEASSPHASGRTFASLPLSPFLQQAISSKFGFTFCTPIQGEAIPAALAKAGTADIVARARTGSGKTLAFLLPALELASAGGFLNSACSIVVLSPTRELAYQIGAEAKTLGLVKVVTVVGGTNVRSDVSALGLGGGGGGGRQLPTLLVGTPGRMQDLLANNGLGRGMPDFAKILVLDEADRLLDMGFRPEIMRILSYLPPPAKRFTMLFSATFPTELAELTKVALRPNFEKIMSPEVADGSGASSVQPIPQQGLTAPQHLFMEALLSILEARPHATKVMAFFVTARLTQYFAQVMSSMRLPGVVVYEMHSRKSMGHRTKESAKFRSASSDGSKRHIMFTSDVSARGMDYPNVDLVVQLGLPADSASYTHRIGRTSRAGAQGEAILVVANNGEVGAARARVKAPGSEKMAWHTLAATEPRADVQRACAAQGKQINGQAYQSWLGFYNSHLKALRWDKHTLVANGNRWAMDQLGVSEPPALQKRTVGKMGLKGVPGLRVE